MVRGSGFWNMGDGKWVLNFGGSTIDVRRGGLFRLGDLIQVLWDFGFAWDLVLVVFPARMGIGLRGDGLDLGHRHEGQEADEEQEQGREHPECPEEGENLDHAG